MASAAIDNTKEVEIEFTIQRIYIKDVSFETPNSPAIFQQEWAPEVKVDLENNVTELAPGIYEIVLILTVTAAHEEKTVFLCEVKQAGIFTLINMDKSQLAHAVNAYCPNILFPYARETISSLVSRGSFPQINLAPINFDAMFASYFKADE